MVSSTMCSECLDGEHCNGKDNDNVWGRCTCSCNPTPNQDKLRQHTPLTDEILEVVDQLPMNRYEVALRLTRWAEKKLSTEQQQARIDELERLRINSSYISTSEIHKRLAALKAEQKGVKK